MMLVCLCVCFCTCEWIVMVFFYLRQQKRPRLCLYNCSRTVDLKARHVVRMFKTVHAYPSYRHPAICLILKETDFVGLRDLTLKL